MKKKICFFLLCIFGLSIINVNAESLCSYSEQAALNSEVANIKAKYEEKTGILDEDEILCEEGMSCETEYNYFTISVLNLSSNFYIAVTNENNDDRLVLNYNDVKDGLATFNFKGIMYTNTFTFDVYSSDETSCPNEKYRTFTLKTPRKNIYYYYAQCDEHPDIAICQKYVEFEDTGFYDFMDKIEKYEVEQKENNEKSNNKITFIQRTIDFVKENKVPVIIVSIILIIGVGTTTFVVIKRRKKSVL